MKRLIFGLCAVAVCLAALASDKVTYGKNSRLERVNVPVPFFQGKPTATLTGWDFMLQADTTEFWTLEDKIVETILAGNMPTALKSFQKITFTTPVVDSINALSSPHVVEILVLPDYLAVGTDDDFVRMPMGPLAAQRIADSLNCILPTAYLVDRIAEVSEGHLDIFPFRPLGNRNCNPIVFQDSNNAINALYKAKGYKFGQFISGLKKDIILTYQIHTLPGKERNVAIYGWHHPSGRTQQPVHVKHGNFYADYSHGVRLISRTVVIDGKAYDAREVLESPELYVLLSDEPMPLKQASYAGFPRY